MPEAGAVSVAEYEAVVARLNRDPELLAEVRARLAAEAGKRGGSEPDDGGGDR